MSVIGHPLTVYMLGFLLASVILLAEHFTIDIPCTGTGNNKGLMGLMAHSAFTSVLALNK